MATTKATRARNPFQTNDDFPSIAVVRESSSKAPAKRSDYLDTRYVEYVNAEQTIAIISSYGSYAIALRTALTPEQVFTDETITNYADLLKRGIWFVAVDHSLKSKVRARTQAEALLPLIQDVNDPLRVALDGSFAPALTIAQSKWQNTRDYYLDDTRVREVHDIAKQAGVSPVLLGLAIKEDRLIWATPPVAPKQVMVVVQDEATGVLSERLVDEIVLATGKVEGVGQIMHEGSVPAFLLARRERQQRWSVETILAARDEVEKAIEEAAQRLTSLQEDLAKGYVIGRGFHDTVRLAEIAERVQSAATRYSTAVQNADLPDEYALSLRTGTFKDDSRYALNRSDTREALKALSALNGMNIDRY